MTEQAKEPKLGDVFRTVGACGDFNQYTNKSVVIPEGTKAIFLGIHERPYNANTTETFRQAYFYLPDAPGQKCLSCDATTLNTFYKPEAPKMAEQVKTTQVLGADLKLGDQISVQSGNDIHAGWSHHPYSGGPNTEPAIATVVGISNSRRYVAWNATKPCFAPVMTDLDNFTTIGHTRAKPHQIAPAKERDKFNSGSVVCQNETVHRIESKSDMTTTKTTLNKLNVGDKFFVYEAEDGYIAFEPGDRCHKPIEATLLDKTVLLVYGWSSDKSNHYQVSFADGCNRSYHVASPPNVNRIVPITITAEVAKSNRQKQAAAEHKFAIHEVDAIAKERGLNSYHELLCANCNHQFSTHYGNDSPGWCCPSYDHAPNSAPHVYGRYPDYPGARGYFRPAEIAAETTSLKTVPTKMCDLKVGDKFRINIDPAKGYMSYKPGNPAKRPVAAPATIVEIGKHGIVYAWNEPMENYDPSSYGDCAKGYKHATAAVSGYEGLVEHIVPDLKDQPSKYTDEEIRAVAKALGISNPMDVICENCDHRYGDHHGEYTGPGLE